MGWWIWAGKRPAPAVYNRAHWLTRLSNGIRFSISDLSPPTSRLLHCIYRERAGISLYDALHESEQGSDPPKFSEQTITKVADTMQRFKSICDGTGVKEENILVFATEAMRTAGNKDDMLNAIEKKSGWSVNILQPKMESLFGAMGARSGFSNVDGLFMDLGGGSVQMTYMDSESGEGYPMQACQAATSLPYGAARLTGALKGKEPSTSFFTNCDTFKIAKFPISAENHCLFLSMDSNNANLTQPKTQQMQPRRTCNRR